jgi:hypothetical protein
MRTTTIVNGGFEHHADAGGFDFDLALSAYKAQVQSVLETFATAHGVSSDNLVSESDSSPRVVVRSWPDLATAQAWVDCVLSGSLGQGLEFPANINSAQVDPE